MISLKVKEDIAGHDYIFGERKERINAGLAVRVVSREEVHRTAARQKADPGQAALGPKCSTIAPEVA